MANAILHLRDGRTMVFPQFSNVLRRFIHTTADGIVYDIMWSAREPAVSLCRKPRYDVTFDWVAADDLDPDYVELPDGGRYTWPRKDARG